MELKSVLPATKKASSMGSPVETAEEPFKVFFQKSVQSMGNNIYTQTQTHASTQTHTQTHTAPPPPFVLTLQERPETRTQAELGCDSIARTERELQTGIRTVAPYGEEVSALPSAPQKPGPMGRGSTMLTYIVLHGYSLQATEVV